MSLKDYLEAILKRMSSVLNELNNLKLFKLLSKMPISTMNSLGLVILGDNLLFVLLSTPRKNTTLGSVLVESLAGRKK